MSRGPALIGQLREDHFVNFRPAAAAGPDAWGDRPAMRQLQIKSTSADFHAEYETANERGKQQVVSRWTLGNSVPYERSRAGRNVPAPFLNAPGVLEIPNGAQHAECA